MLEMGLGLKAEEIGLTEDCIFPYHDLPDLKHSFKQKYWTHCTDTKCPELYVFLTAALKPGATCT